MGAGGEETYEDNLLIYPGGKDEPETEPFKEVFQRFKKSMQESNVCYVVGFSFRDDYLNKIFTEFLQRGNTELHCISNNASANVTTLLGASLDEYLRNGQVILHNKSFEQASANGL